MATNIKAPEIAQEFRRLHEERLKLLKHQQTIFNTTKHDWDTFFRAQAGTIPRELIPEPRIEKLGRHIGNFIAAQYAGLHVIETSVPGEHCIPGHLFGLDQGFSKTDFENQAFISDALKKLEPFNNVVAQWGIVLSVIVLDEKYFFLSIGKQAE